MAVGVPLNNILESATHTAVIVADFDGRINVFNQGAANLFGYTPEEAKDRRLPELRGRVQGRELGRDRV